MTRRISKFQRFIMQNPIIQFFYLAFIGAKVAIIVTLGHGGTRDRK